jgi:methionyl aminopeptidase
MGLLKNFRLATLDLYMTVIIKTDQELQSMRAGGKIHARILRMVCERVMPGVTTAELDTYAESLCHEYGCTPAFKNYQPDGQSSPFPATICASINEEIVHGIPSPDRILQSGDIISIDLGIQYQGVFLDGATTVPVGIVPRNIQEFLQATEQSLLIGIARAIPGNTTGDIGYAIQSYVNKRYGIVKGLAGHGVGRHIHEDPFVPNYGKRGQGTELVPGMTLAIEPMLTMGNPATDILDDDWTFVTADGSLSAHFEHTIIITEHGPEIVTVE